MDILKQKEEKYVPLAFRMKPRDFTEFVGQSHIAGKESLLRKRIEQGHISSLIFFGPPGCGKTSLAYIICNLTKSHFVKLDAVTSSVQDIRKTIDEAKKIRAFSGKRTILLIDELHRFNKAQQEVLLPSTEEGTLIFIGTTTYNPYFYITPPLQSRSKIIEFHPLSPEEIKKIIIRSLQDKERGLGNLGVNISKDALNFVINKTSGDARQALDAIEASVSISKDITLEIIKEAFQKKAIYYGKDEHFDTISAFIKSMRGSDVDASLYWLAKMIKAGEDPRFIARRIVICAAEDVGLANPHALVIANSAMQAVEYIGMPEAILPLAEATIYVATCKKSNSCYKAIKKAEEDVEKRLLQEVPRHLKTHSKDYKYAHDYRNHWVEQEYMPERRIYYEPGDLGYEAEVKEWLATLKKEG
ncbi:MAG: replication-associated recombination protein A [bacterium]|nr:replication-associated recombination protein A [bacterium]